MSSEAIGAIALGVMLLLMAARMPVALAMLLTGAGGFAAIIDGNGALEMLKGIPMEILANYDFSAIPLFILMGVLAAHSGMAGSLFAATRTLFGSMRGGLGIAVIGSCGIFASISGSSLATASTMTRAALPEMEKYGYQPSLAAGALAAGGTLGIMIPPSIALLVYAVLTEQPVGDLFIAGFIPGLLGMVMYSLTVLLLVWRFPHLAKRGAPTTWREKARALVGLIPFSFIFCVIILGIFFGLFTPTEGAAVGAFASLCYAVMRQLPLPQLWMAFAETLALSAVVFLMLMGAQALGYMISVSRISFTVSEWISTLQVSSLTVILLIIALYFVLGMFMDAIAMLVITVPVVYPVIQQLGINPIYFGIISVLTVELGLITPPVGMNVFVIKAVAPQVPLSHIFRGVMPFILSDFIRLALLIAFPVLTLGLL